MLCAKKIAFFPFLPNPYYGHKGKFINDKEQRQENVKLLQLYFSIKVCRSIYQPINPKGLPYEQQGLSTPSISH